jgi:hypothetical protein
LTEHFHSLHLGALGSTACAEWIEPNTVKTIPRKL